ncbi:SPOR domain-containing protein [Tuberibacillus sp. Marseille-P3662]|uniref:SPOR domain-containing protein n=1 Tax=Tuberibacillus sp. Marseille-P3662 TaxID=1965358 RepID=UPI000A1CA7A3|nr:SPOR domain-containing protein [Tuberibacillus sp. Marseille-P3662]
MANQSFHDDDNISVEFNGHKTKLDKPKEETSAADSDRTLNWQPAFGQTETEEGPEQQSSTIDTDKTIHFKPHRKKMKKKKRGRSIINKKSPHDHGVIFKKFWIPLLSAIVVGLGTGFSVLLFVNSSPENKNLSSPAEGGTSTRSNQTHQSDQTSGSFPTDQLTLKINAAQAGAFKSSDRATERVKEVKNKDMSAVIIKVSDYYRVIVGISGSQNGIKDKVGQYEQKLGKDQVIDKTFNLSTSSVSGIEKQETFDHLVKGKTFLTKLVDQSSQGFPADDKLIKDIKTWKNKDIDGAPKLLVEFEKQLSNTAKESGNGQQQLLQAVSQYTSILNQSN